ncbi:MAG: nucleotidyltransferase domain-containing protein [Candidatus Delongbacteria bacterium]|nr:nucleotidyltransferase domain-containing protein [Candidatus Delongbacteria bacterium]
MNKVIFDSIKKIKPQYANEGFMILGVFGSYSRGDYNNHSDIDILYEITPEFIKTYGGFGSCSRIEKIKEELEDFLGHKIDLANKKALSDIGKKYILPEVEYV